ncbi:hypothetical protein K7X08_025864 [Anisodus acutangulus]|uniref:DNA-(apurinic or apyrimidinic site) lyase n=1 Tax=Anisodus acutangulus TaxID=402998 RepID=A0A9Q1QY26_9SOLA|nr:hypothetical protein K7X08_025864 [Anisodus acutangulus]
MKRPATIPSTPSTPPPSPQTFHSKTTTLRSLSSKKPRNILTNPTPTTITTTEQENPKWVPLNLSRSELYLPLTFPTGQTFRWKQTGPTQYTGVVGRSHLVSLKHLDNGDVGYHFHYTKDTGAREALLDFLNVGISLTEVWEGFKASDKRFAELAIHLGGARVLRQDPLECLIQFICSSNNNIKRITMMVDFISSLGNYLGAVGGFKFYEFPSLERLTMVSEQDLRAAGFGYRAKYIVGTVEALKSKPGGGTEWLAALRKVDLPEAIVSLCSLPGVGPKVAACIALFSLDQHHAIPVDTHVWKIATRYLLPELAGTSLTPKLHNRVADAFVRTYGKYAGWAQTLLFIAELPSQKALLNSTEEKSPNSKKRKQDLIKTVLSSSEA